MDAVDVVAAGLAGLLIGSYLNRLVVREPGYVITDPGDLPEGADPAVLDELEPAPVLDRPVPVLAVARPATWWRRWFPVVEVATALAFGLTVHRLGWGTPTVAVLFLSASLVVLAAIDFRVYRIPDRVNLPSMLVGFGLLSLASLTHDVPGAVIGAALGGFSYATVLFLAHVAYPRGMGWGDVKLAWLMGFYLGWAGWLSVAAGQSSTEKAVTALQYVLFGAALGSLVGVLVGGAYAVIRRSTKVVFPYGPSLAVGCLVVVLYGGELV